jgi:tRNA 5-methylaminomethyl-2-thiouridine biosynthesis bifunctional protein
VKTERITSARIDFDAEGGPHAPDFGDRYHARAGALEQAAHVFLRGNGLPERWRARERFVVLETGFGLGHNFIATWLAWRADAARCTRLHYLAVDKHPPSVADLRRAHGPLIDAGGEPARAAQELQAAWPPLTGDLHRLVFEGGRIELLLAFGDAATWLRRLQLQADAIYLDGFAPERNPQMWSAALFAALPALCAAGATVATWSVAREVRDGLAAGGFAVERAPGFAGKREMTVARFAPRYVPRANARAQAAMPSARRALVVGAGIAGAAAAAALAEEGLAVTVLEAGPAPASGASGNPAGLFRGLLARDDGAHARWHRAAALQGRRLVEPLHRSAGLAAGLQGVLHLGETIEELHRRIDALGLPGEYVRALDGRQAAALAGLPAFGPAAHFTGGGWVDVAALVRACLGGEGIEVSTGCSVQSLRRAGAAWQALDERGHVRAEADLAVLAGAAGTAHLVPASARWPLPPRGLTRGQITLVPRATPGLTVSALPLARNGYAVTLPGGDVLCGATQTATDSTAQDARLREDDHRHNLAVLARLTGKAPLIEASALASLAGRAALRWHADDRLPLIGALPAAALPVDLRAAPASGWTQPRHVPREQGLFALTALGTRGIAGAALGARVLAAWACGAPMPLDTDLLDAVDAARHFARAARSPGAPVKGPAAP